METKIAEGSEITQINSREGSETSVEADKSEDTAESVSAVTEQRGGVSPLANGPSNLSDKAIGLEDKLKVALQRIMDLEKELTQASEKEEQVVLLEEKLSKAEKEREDAFLEATSLRRELSNLASEGFQFKDEAKLSEKLEEKTENTLALREKVADLQEQFAHVELKRKEVEDKLSMQTQLLQEEMKIRALKEVELHDVRATLSRLEMDLAHFEEKVVCLEGQLKLTMDKTEEKEKLAKQNEENFVNSFERALELDNLSIISESRAKEMEQVVISLQEDIQGLRGKLAFNERTQEALNETEGKLFKLEEQLKHSQERICELVQKLSSAGVVEEYGNYLKMHDEAETRMKERSLALEKLSVDSDENLRLKLFDLNDKFQETKKTEEPIEDALKQVEANSSELHREIHNRMAECAECTVGQLSGDVSLLESNRVFQSQVNVSEHELQESLRIAEEKCSGYEDIAKNSTERLFEVDNLAGVLLGILKDTQDKLDALGLDLKNASEREIELETKLKYAGEQFSAQESILHHATTRCMELEQLLESQANDTEVKLLETKENYARADSEVRNLREKLNALLDLVKESDDRVPHASVSAVERQVELQASYAKLADMEILLQDLQGKILVAEGRAQKAEAECTVLAEKASKVNAELAHVQSYMDELQTALLQVESEKQSAAEQVTSAAKSINDLVKQLAEERQRVKIQDAHSENLHLKSTSGGTFGRSLLPSDLMGVRTTKVPQDQAVPVSNFRTSTYDNFTGPFRRDFKLMLAVAVVSVVIGLIIGRSS